MQIIASGDKMTGKKKMKTFVAVVSGSVLASLFSHFQASVEDANQASESLTRSDHPAT
jgi:hypothetical protein